MRFQFATAFELPISPKSRVLSLQGRVFVPCLPLLQVEVDVRALRRRFMVLLQQAQLSFRSLLRDIPVEVQSSGEVYDSTGIVLANLLSQDNGVWVQVELDLICAAIYHVDDLRLLWSNNNVWSSVNESL